MSFSFFQRKTITPSQTKEKKDKNSQKLSINDNRSNALEITHLQNDVNDSSNTQSITQLQEKVDNNTGMPNDLKQGIENLSGIDMSDVKVTYNSDKPAQLQAHAYANGNDIQIAPGQEKYLPHEAWHVVQQKQGRVQPTMQLKSNLNVNDDSRLEKEANLMGEKAKNSPSESATDKKLDVVSNYSNNMVQLAAKNQIAKIEKIRKQIKLYHDVIESIKGSKEYSNASDDDKLKIDKLKLPDSDSLLDVGLTKDNKGEFDAFELAAKAKYSTLQALVLKGPKGIMDDQLRTLLSNNKDKLYKEYAEVALLVGNHIKKFGK